MMKGSTRDAMILSMSESKDSRARAEKSLRELAKLDPELNVEEILDSEAAGFEVSIDPETGEERVGMKTQKSCKNNCKTL